MSNLKYEYCSRCVWWNLECLFVGIKNDSMLLFFWIYVCFCKILDEVLRYLYLSNKWEGNKNNKVNKWFYKIMLIVNNIFIKSVRIGIVKNSEINVYIL